MATGNLVSTPSGYSIIKFGTATITATSTYVDVVLTGLPANYQVVLTPTGTLTSSVVLFTTNKTTGGFRINSLAAPTSDVSIDYIVIA